MATDPLQAKVVVKYTNHNREDETFFNARVIVQPPFIVVANDAEKLGVFLIGEVAAVLFPEGSNKVSL